MHSSRLSTLSGRYIFCEFIIISSYNICIFSYLVWFVLFINIRKLWIFHYIRYSRCTKNATIIIPKILNYILIAIIIPINAFKTKYLYFFIFFFFVFFALLLENLLLAYIFVYSIILFNKSFVNNKQKKSTR